MTNRSRSNRVEPRRAALLPPALADLTRALINQPAFADKDLVRRGGMIRRRVGGVDNGVD